MKSRRAGKEWDVLGTDRACQQAELLSTDRVYQQAELLTPDRVWESDMRIEHGFEALPLDWPLLFHA